MLQYNKYERCDTRGIFFSKEYTRLCQVINQEDVLMEIIKV